MTELDPLHILTLQFLPGVDKSLLQGFVDYIQFTPSTSPEDLSEVIGSLISFKRSQFQAASKQAEQILEESKIF